jgi:hypothetical protein
MIGMYQGRDRTDKAAFSDPPTLTGSGPGCPRFVFLGNWTTTLGLDEACGLGFEKRRVVMPSSFTPTSGRRTPGV